MTTDDYPQVGRGWAYPPRDHGKRRTFVGPHLIIGFGRAARAGAQDEAVEDRLPCECGNFHHARVASERCGGGGGRSGFVISKFQFHFLERGQQFLTLLFPAGRKGLGPKVFDPAPGVTVRRNARLMRARLVADLKCAIVQRLKAQSGHSFAASGKTTLCKGS